SKAQNLLNAAAQQAQVHHQHELDRLNREFEAVKQRLNQDWKRAVKEALERLDQRPRKLDEQAQRVTQKNEARHRAKLAQLKEQHPATLQRLEQEGEAALQQLAERRKQNEAKRAVAYEANLLTLETEWKNRIEPL